MMVSSMIPPFSFVNKESVACPSGRLTRSATTKLSKNFTRSFPLILWENQSLIEKEWFCWPQLCHVWHIEEWNFVSSVKMRLYYSLFVLWFIISLNGRHLYLYGQLPSSKINHFPSQFHMEIVQCSFLSWRWFSCIRSARVPNRRCVGFMKLSASNSDRTASIRCFVLNWSGCL